MFFKQLFVFVAVLLCAQYSLCNVIKTKESEDIARKTVLAILKKELQAEDQSDTSFEQSLDICLKLVVLISVEIFPMSKISLTPVKNIFKDVIADVGNLNNSDGTPYPYLVEIKDLVHIIEKYETKQDRFGYIPVFNDLEMIIIKFHDENEKNKILTIQDEQFSQSLKKNGYEAFETEFKTHYIVFVDKIYKAALSNWNTLSDDEKFEAKRFGEWLTLMKDEQNEEKRCDLFSNIYDIITPKRKINS